MMYRIVYTKLSYSLLSQCKLDILCIQSIYSARLFTFGCASGKPSSRVLILLVYIQYKAYHKPDIFSQDSEHESS